MNDEKKEPNDVSTPESGLDKGQGNAPGEAASAQRPRIDLSKQDDPGQAKTDAVRPGASKTDETMRVVLPKEDEVKTGSFRRPEGDGRPKRTIRLKRPGAAPQTEGGIPEGRPAAGPKADTSRIDLDQARAQPTPEQVEGAKLDTARIKLDPSGGAAAGQAQQRTVRIARDAGAEVDQGAVTVVDGEGPKSSTAKLNIPSGAAGEARGGPRKTIRIKRPEGSAPGTGATRTLRISRAEAPQSRAALPTSAEQMALRMAQPQGEERPHAAFAMAALLAVLLAGVLVYALMAEMPFGAEWPWYGKIVTRWLGPPII